MLQVGHMNISITQQKNIKAKKGQHIAINRYKLQTS